MTADEFVEYTLSSKVPMSAGKFLVKEFCDEIGFTLEHLKKLESVFDRLDDKHKYEKVIYDAYVANGEYSLTDAQRLAAYESYKEVRKSEEETAANGNARG